MINNRPELLRSLPYYTGVPTREFGVDMAAIPELVRLSLDALGGVQPVTGAIAAAAGGDMYDKPSEGEIALHQRLGSRFQLIMVVMNVAALREQDGKLLGAPYSISLMPASKRGEVDTSTIEFVAQMDPAKLMGGQPCYQGYDPFEGDWGMFGALDFFRNNTAGHLDEVGLVIDHYYLATTFDEADVLTLGLNVGSPEAQAKFNKHRNKRFFRPFERAVPRRVWGAESPIELFLHQGLLQRGLSPLLQMILCDDGTTYGALYHLWRDRRLDALPGQITEADFYFPEARLAVFCDSSRFHSRRRDQAKDKAINDRLNAAGFKALRLTGPAIVRDLGGCVDAVVRALDEG